MTPKRQGIWASVLVVALILTTARWAQAGAEPSDLKREIESQQSGANDLERLDEQRSVTGELTLLRAWLDEAWGLFSKEDYDKVREVLDRCIAQAELIRQSIAASKITTQARAREAALAASRDKVTKTKVALQQAQIKKKAMEMNSK